MFFGISSFCHQFVLHLSNFLLAILSCTFNFSYFDVRCSGFHLFPQRIYHVVHTIATTMIVLPLNISICLTPLFGLMEFMKVFSACIIWSAFLPFHRFLWSLFNKTVTLCSVILLRHWMHFRTFCAYIVFLFLISDGLDHGLGIPVFLLHIYWTLCHFLYDLLVLILATFHVWTLTFLLIKPIPQFFIIGVSPFRLPLLSPNCCFLCSGSGIFRSSLLLLCCFHGCRVSSHILISLGATDLIVILYNTTMFSWYLPAAFAAPCGFALGSGCVIYSIVHWAFWLLQIRFTLKWPTTISTSLCSWVTARLLLVLELCSSRFLILSCFVVLCSALGALSLLSGSLETRILHGGGCGRNSLLSSQLPYFSRT